MKARIQFSQVLCHFITRIAFPLVSTGTFLIPKALAEWPLLPTFLQTFSPRPLSYSLGILTFPLELASSLSPLYDYAL